jgi:hypothetical protein
MITTVGRIRAAGGEPTLADFEHALAYAKRGAIITCTGLNAEVQRASTPVRAAAPNPPSSCSTAPWMPS